MMGVFDHFRRVMSGPTAPQSVTEIAEFLEEQTWQACKDCGLTNADVYSGGGLVTMFLTERDAWEAVIVGPNAYQLYPGFLSEGGKEIIWPNVWVADNYNLDRFVLELEQAFAKAVNPDN